MIKSLKLTWKIIFKSHLHNIEKGGEVLSVLGQRTYSFNIEEFEEKLRDNNEPNLGKQSLKITTKPAKKMDFY